MLGFKKKGFWWKHFESVEKWDSTSFRQTFCPDKWDLREGYGEPNLSEKGFQLFQLLWFGMRISIRQGLLYVWALLL